LSQQQLLFSTAVPLQVGNGIVPTVKHTQFVYPPPALEITMSIDNMLHSFIKV